MQVLHEGAVLSEEVQEAAVSFVEERTHVAVSRQLKGGPGEARDKCWMWR